MKLIPIFDEAIKESKALMALHNSAVATGALPAGISPEVFLRASLVFALSAVDKILHEAISKHFTSLARKEILDRFVEFKVSKAYEIALAARKPAGVGGAIKRRPGHDIKTEVLTAIYKDSYLSNRMLQEICAACGRDKIFGKFAQKLGGRRRSKTLQTRWSRIYHRRNQIAHESDIQQRERMRRVSFNPVDARKTKKDIQFVESFGRFLASELE